MQAAVDAFQRKLFIFLLYVSGFGAFVHDFFTYNRTIFFAALDGLIILLGITSLAYIRPKLALIFLFIIVCFIVNISYSEASTFASINGFREIFFILCMIAFYAKIFREGNEETIEDYINIVKNFAFAFLVLNIPATIYQWAKFGPSDHVGGVVGDMSSGVMTVVVICLVYFLHFFSRNFSVTVLLYICLAPLMLNETKISFILIPMMMLFIWVKLQAKNIMIGLGGAVLIFFIFNNFYSASYLDFDNNAAGIFTSEFLSDYLMADIYAYEDIPRFTKIILAWQFITEQTNTFLFGIEYGLFRGGASGEYSSFAQTYYWLLAGTRPYLYYLLMQGGIMLTLGFLWLNLYLNKFFREINKFKVFLFTITLIMLAYNDVLRNQFYVVIYFFLVFYANSSFYEKNLKNI